MIAPARTLVAVMRADLARDGIVAAPDPVGLPVGPSDPASVMLAELARPTFRVWSGASDRTIFGPAADNYVFRCWHDVYGHAMTGADFTYHGEAETVRAHVARFRGRRWSHVRDLIVAEGWGQVVHHARHGGFPVDQRAFTLACLNEGIDRAAATDWAAAGR